MALSTLANFYNFGSKDILEEMLRELVVGVRIYTYKQLFSNSKVISETYSMEELHSPLHNKATYRTET